MPVERSTNNGKPCYRWGNEGKCYSYTAGDKASRETAKRKAESQGRAIQASKNVSRKNK